MLRRDSVVRSNRKIVLVNDLLCGEPKNSCIAVTVWSEPPIGKRIEWQIFLHRGGNSNGPRGGRIRAPWIGWRQRPWRSRNTDCTGRAIRIMENAVARVRRGHDRN